MNCKPFFAPPWTLDGTDCPSAIQTEPGRCISQPQPLQDVGETAHNPTAVEQELDRVIAELGDRMMEAMRTGDKTGAAIYLDRMTAAIGSRSPEHQQRLHAKAWQRMLDEDPCYFSACGERDAERGGNA
jgi:hypothetical protein